MSSLPWKKKIHQSFCSQLWMILHVILISFKYLWRQSLPIYTFLNFWTSRVVEFKRVWHSLQPSVLLLGCCQGQWWSSPLYWSRKSDTSGSPSLESRSWCRNERTQCFRLKQQHHYSLASLWRYWSFSQRSGVFYSNVFHIRWILLTIYFLTFYITDSSAGEKNMDQW